ncbi:GNAT family N-acetyltransferase [Chishuiella changwenlii]|uniref:GNAT family N-acetyltransferase n=1 Tax=Chishuiella changwenlii TaxID=1434701 RepID=UPI002FD979B4
MKQPPYDVFPEIISDEIILREIQIEDVKDIVEISFYDSRPASTVEDAITMQEKINLDYLNGSSIHWGIVDKQTNSIVGTLGYYRGLDKGVGELGCVLKSNFRGKGFMTLAMTLAIEFGIKNIGLKEIIAITTTQNRSAVKLLERLNFVKTRNLEEDEIEYKYLNIA